MARRIRARIAVRLQERARAVLDHAVRHDLHGRRTDVAVRRGAPALDQLVDLLVAPMPVPPEARADPHRELAGRVQRAVRLEDVGRHPRVLPARDAERVQPLLRQEQRPAPLRLVGPRDEPIAERVGGPLVQRAGRLPRHRVPLDATVPRIGRVLRDAADLERAAVHPRPVHVPVHQEDGTVGNDAIQLLSMGRTAGEQVHRPSAPRDPRLVGVGGRVRGDRLQVGVDGRDVIQVHPQEVPAAERGMHVCVLEPGNDQPPGQGQDLGRGSGEFPQLTGGPHRRDAPVRHRDLTRTGQPVRVEGRVRDDQVGCPAHGRAEPTWGRLSGKNPT